MSKMRESDFTLSYKEMEEIRRRERLKTQHKHRERPFSDFLSPEAQLAMKMVIKESIMNAMDGDGEEKDENVGTKGNLKKDASATRQRHVSFETGPDANNVTRLNIKAQSAMSDGRRKAASCSHHEKRCHDDTLRQDMEKDAPEKLRRSATIAEIYEKRAIRIEGDITDSNYQEFELKYRTLDGRKPGNTMETVEIINADDDTCRQSDAINEFVIEETARKNAVEKCLVWMEANAAMDEPAHSPLSE